MPNEQQKGLDFGAADPRPTRRRALTVSQLTDRIQGVLQTEFFDVWVEGEISNLRTLPSGIVYFSLKDANAQIQCVVFKQQGRLLKVKPREGARVLARGSVRVYPPKGSYDLSVEVIEPLGKGALQQAYEDLKERLDKEGLFDRARKRPLPALPRRIGVVTSPGGAVIQDILRVLARRYPNLDVLVYPARVQGPEAAGEIVQGLRVLNALPLAIDVIIVARGGGSLEDLWPFNEEAVARALSTSRIPTISAVGHETDVTIADFAADHRAPTPSAAAELVVKAKEDIAARLLGLERRASSAVRLRLGRSRAALSSLAAERVLQLEQTRLRTLAQQVQGLERRSAAALTARVTRTRARLAAVGPGRVESALRRRLELAVARDAAVRARLGRASPGRQLGERRQAVDRAATRLRTLAAEALVSRRTAFAAVAARLDGLSPLAVLSRGYAVAFDDAGHILREARAVAAGDRIRVRLHEGTLDATVTREDT